MFNCKKIKTLCLILLGFVFFSSAAFAQDKEAEFPMLDYAKLDNYSSQDLYEYTKALGQLMSEIEKFQASKGVHVDKVAWLFKLIEESYANGGCTQESLPPYSRGQCCLIGGGHWGAFTTRANGGLTCDSPNRCQMQGGGTGHQCNPLFFTSQPNGTPFCVGYSRGLTTESCLPAFDRMYNQMCPGANNGQVCSAFVEHFKANVRRANGGKDDPATVRAHVARIQREYQRINSYCFDGSGNIREHALGQKESCFRLREYYQRILSIAQQIRSPNYGCIDSGIASAGISYSRPSAQVGLLLLRSRELADSRIPMRFWGPRVRGEAAIKSTIMSLTAVGVCTNTPMSAGAQSAYNQQMSRDRVPAYEPVTYTNLFGASPQVIRDQGLQNYDLSHRASNWNSNAGETLRSCQKTEMTTAQKREFCVKLHRACGLNTSACNPQRDTGGGNDNGRNNGSSNGGNNGGDNGGNNGGNNNGGNNGGNTGTAESGNDSNEAGGDNGGGHGVGPQ